MSQSALSTIPLSQRRLPPGVAFYLQASIVVLLLAGSSAPTPLYSIYQAEWGFSPITTTMIFGVYALAVLVALLTVGSLSDHVGRRPLLLVALGIQALVMLFFASADGVPELMIARIVQGLATGTAIGALGAGMLDLNKAKGTIANSVAPMIGTGSGAFLAGLLIQFLPDPTHLVYLVLFGIFVIQAVGVLLMRESSSPAPGALASLRPQVSAPASVRRPLLIAVPALVATWALAGFYGAFGPTLVRLVTGHTSYVLGGLSLFTLASSGALTVLLLRNREPRSVMLVGMVALVVGVALTLEGVTHSSATAFFLATAIAGAGFGAGFQGAIRTVIPLAAPHQRSGVLSTMFVVSYLAMGLPAVIGGFLVVYGGGVLTTAKEYGLAIMVLAALALLGVARQLRRATAAEPALPAATLSELTVLELTEPEMMMQR